MNDERRCYTCDRVVYQHSEHAGYMCENWPEIAIGQTEVEYRDYKILRVGDGPVFNYRVAKLDALDDWLAQVPSWVWAFRTVDDLISKA